MEKPQHNPQGVKTIRLSQRELAVILEEVDRKAGSEAAHLRCEPRLPFGDGSPVLLKVSHPGGSLVELIVKVRNLSSRGMGFINGSYLYPNTPVTVTLRRLTGELAPITGNVVRCTHIRGFVHDVGVRFENAIDLIHFVDDGHGGRTLTPLRKAAANLPQFEGAVLHIDPSVDNRELMEFVLVRLGLTVESVTSVSAGLEAAAKRMFDAIVIDLRVKDIDAMDVPQMLRERNYPGPIIAVSPEDTVEAEAAARDRGFSYLLPKPLRQDSAKIMAERYMRRKIQGNGGKAIKPLLSQFWADVEMRPLIMRFLGRLEQTVGKMARHLSEQNLEALELACTDVVGIAAGYGYPDIQELVSGLQMLCNLKSPPEQVARHMEELVRICEAALMVRRTAPK